MRRRDSQTTAPTRVYDSPMASEGIKTTTSGLALRRLRPFPAQRRGPGQVVMELKDRVYGVHLKDEKEMNTKASSNVVIGKGANLDVVGLFKALRRSSSPPTGALSLEYEANPQNPIDDMKACLEVAREAIARFRVRVQGSGSGFRQRFG